MKRSLPQSTNSAEGPSSSPAIKRAHSESKLSEDDHKSDNSFYLIHQNRELGKELKRKQQKLHEYEEQTAYYNGQIQRIEEFIGFLDRVWHQFEHDISTLLETLGNPTHDHNTDLDGTEGNEGVWSSLLQQYLEANQTYFLSIPCCVSGELDVDEWSNEPEIDEAKIQALENCLDSSSGLEIVKEELMNRLEFSKKSVEKLYDIVNHQTTGQLATILTPLTEDRNIRTELDLLRDQVTKYKHEVITISAEMAYLKRKLQKAEKRLEAPVISNLSSTDTPVLTRSSSVQSVTTTTEKKDSVSSEHQNLDSMNVVEVIVHDTPLCQHNGEVVESRIVVTEAVSKLQQQLEEARQRMVAAEKSLTDYMASAPMTPPTNHAAEIARLQKLLTEVRTISNKKLADVRAEKGALVDKISGLERAMSELVSKTEQTIDQMAIACAEELAKEKGEKEKIQLALNNAEAEAKLIANMRSQVSEMQAIHDASKSKLEKLTERVKSQDKTLSLLESHLNTSKQREDALERSIKDIASQNETKRREKGEGLPTANEDEEEGVVHESSTSNQMFAQLYANSQARCKELEAELADAKANMDELIVEIEAVATEEEKTRTQNARLLKQLTEGHNVHKGVLQENLRLHQDIITLQEKEALANTKVENITNHMKVIESTLQQLRQAEQGARAELVTTTATLSELKMLSENQQKKIEELESQLQQKVTESQKYQERLLEFQERCHLLSTNCDEERTKRLELERLRDDDRRERERESNRISVLMAKAAENETKSDQSTMLEMTLNMLRCSVCKDRFKQVAITKCFHLFCKECINENLKNRNRKCPACGEKFGQDDVKTVFFAH